MRGSFIPDTHLPRYGEGDWNDSLQPADPALRNTMVSSWTVALLYQQLVRFADVLHRAGRKDSATGPAALALEVRQDFNDFLIRDGTVAGYALFDPGSAKPELLLHPSDVRTGLRYSLIPMTRSILAGLFTPEQVQHHLRLIREHLLFPDGARLIDRPAAYHGGLERTFRRAESAAFFGREIGLMLPLRITSSRPFTTAAHRPLIPRTQGWLGRYVLRPAVPRWQFWQMPVFT